MKSQNLFLVISLFVLSLKVSAEKPVPVLVADFSVDASLYDLSGSYNNLRTWYVTFEGPLTYETQTGFALRRKNSDQFDIYSFAGKMGTITVPIVSTQENGELHIYFSRSMLDNDDGWESIINYMLYGGEDRNYFFKVYDDDETELLSDSGRASYGFDGENTYVALGSLSRFQIDSYIKVWQFRTNIQNSSSQNLAKQAASHLPIQIIGHSGGDYRVTLSPTNGNQIDFQMFDLLGRCVFAKKINNLTSPVSFTVHENNIPASPFIARVSDGEKSYYKRQIPVK